MNLIVVCMRSQMIDRYYESCIGAIEGNQIEITV